MLRNRCWPTTFHTRTGRPVWSTPSRGEQQRRSFIVWLSCDTVTNHHHVSVALSVPKPAPPRNLNHPSNNVSESTLQCSLSTCCIAQFTPMWHHHHPPWPLGSPMRAWSHLHAPVWTHYLAILSLRAPIQAATIDSALGVIITVTITFAAGISRASLISNWEQLS